MNHKMQDLARAFSVWAAVLTVCGLVELRCGHTRYDHRASLAAGCTQTSSHECIQPLAGWVGNAVHARSIAWEVPADDQRLDEEICREGITKEERSRGEHGGGQGECLGS